MPHWGSESRCPIGKVRVLWTLLRFWCQGLDSIRRPDRVALLESREKKEHLSFPRGFLVVVMWETTSVQGGAVSRDQCPRWSRISGFPGLDLDPRSQEQGSCLYWMMSYLSVFSLCLVVSSVLFVQLQLCCLHSVSLSHCSVDVAFPCWSLSCIIVWDYWANYLNFSYALDLILLHFKNLKKKGRQRERERERERECATLGGLHFDFCKLRLEPTIWGPWAA